MGNANAKYEEAYDAVLQKLKRDPYFKGRYDTYLAVVNDAKNRQYMIDAAKNFNKNTKEEIMEDLIKNIKGRVDAVVPPSSQVAAAAAFGRRTKKTNGVLMFGNTAAITLADMMGDVEHKDQAEFGRRKRRKSKKRVSFGKKRRGSKKSRKHRRA